MYGGFVCPTEMGPRGNRSVRFAKRANSCEASVRSLDVKISFLFLAYNLLVGAFERPSEGKVGEIGLPTSK